MEDNKIQIRYEAFRSEIEDFLMPNDIDYFMGEFNGLFSIEDQRYIKNSDSSSKAAEFCKKFNMLSNSSKYSYLKKAAEKHNKWIYLLLDFDNNNANEESRLKATLKVLANLLRLIEKLKNSFKLHNSFFTYLYSMDIVSKANKEILEIELSNKGNESALFKLFCVLSKKDPNWYGHILYLFSKNDFSFIHILCEDLEMPNDLDDEQQMKICMDYAKKFIDLHVQHYQLENDIGCLSNKMLEKEIDDNFSDYSSMVDENENENENDLDYLNDSNEEHQELCLKPFQTELVQTAINGKNTIIYAPTGSGKTNVAVFIANHHLKQNPNGKVAFLVHRTPLVMQQYRVFQKYKHENLRLSSMCGKSDNVSGPLIAHLPLNDIIVMTSDILRNALNSDDGNQISSICEFSLIFFDECHNCMKAHPYTRIMEKYFKERSENSNKKLPQIVGLTASPRSKKKNDRKGMIKSLYELCANMDCYDFSMVIEHRDDLNVFLSPPKQIVKQTNNRHVDEFENIIIKEMEFCEQKLGKMINEGYFPKSEIKAIPADKTKQEYIGFVGNLERLNTVTIDECDGKQKAYSIYRYLNAYYRGMIVNQMFDHKYAKKSIQKYLKHNGVDFTCSYDEEFYKNYKDKILSDQYEQSENPAINEIISQIGDQLSNIQDSRIIVFVREIDFAIYLADILNNTDIPSDAIVGSSAKNESKSCTFNEINNILDRFKNGKTKVLVSTTVVEEGLDVANCNMVISYGHVTNETAMVQRRGRARASDSMYLLILPPMLWWLSKKEIVNEHRKQMMNAIIDQFQSLDKTEMRQYIKTYQRDKILSKREKQIPESNDSLWRFTCKSCQKYICSTLNLRIIENAHRICILPELLKTFRVVKEAIQSFGSQGLYEYGGKVLCNSCNNYQLGNYIYFKKIEYFQPDIKKCNISDKNGAALSCKKWQDTKKYFEISSLTSDDVEEYVKGLEKYFDNCV